MKKVPEDVNVTITEEPSVSSVKDIDLTVNTGDAVTNSSQTELINGEILAIIISANKLCKVCIRFTEIEDIVVYENLEFSGIQYIPLAITAQSNNATLLNYSQACWYLNNGLTVTVEGQKQTNIDITIRYKDA